jgi:hypothetical protein
MADDFGQEGFYNYNYEQQQQQQEQTGYDMGGNNFGFYKHVNFTTKILTDQREVTMNNMLVE